MANKESVVTSTLNGEFASKLSCKPICLLTKLITVNKWKKFLAAEQEISLAGKPIVSTIRVDLVYIDPQSTSVRFGFFVNALGVIWINGPRI